MEAIATFGDVIHVTANVVCVVYQMQLLRLLRFVCWVDRVGLHRRRVDGKAKVPTWQRPVESWTLTASLPSRLIKGELLREFSINIYRD